MVVRNRPRDNLRCSTVALVDQYSNRSLGQSIFRICLQKSLFEFLSLEIPDRSGIEEEICKLHAFGFLPARTVSKIQNHARRAFLQKPIKLLLRFVGLAGGKIWNF